MEGTIPANEHLDYFSRVRPTPDRRKTKKKGEKLEGGVYILRFSLSKTHLLKPFGLDR